MRILIVSPHPDDETLGAGGYILRKSAEKNELFWMNMTAMLDDEKYSSDIREIRNRQLDEIEKFYKFKAVFHLNFPTTELENVNSSEAIHQISRVFREIRPEVLILPDFNDVHSDHRKVFDWCYSCSKVFRYPYVKKIMTMEILSETDFGRPENPFVPNYYVDISEYMDDKLKALNIYETELEALPFPRNSENVKAIATIRGATAGVRYAEAFRIIKWIE